MSLRGILYNRIPELVITKRLLLPDGSTAAPALARLNAPTTGWRFIGNNIRYSTLGNPWGVEIGGTSTIFLQNGSGQSEMSLGGSGSVMFLGLGNTSCINWSATLTAPGTTDLSFCRGGAPGTLRIFAGTTPTLSGCGTGATITGNNSLGTVVIGSTPGTCVVTFNGTWTNTPKCFLQNRTTAQLIRGTTNGTTSVTMGGTIAANDNIDYLCLSS